MKACWYERPGPAAAVLRVDDAPTPAPEPGEVLVQIAVSGVNHGDVRQRAGEPGGALDFERIIPHHDGAGRIVEVGPGIDPRRRDERVWLHSAQFERAHGTAAEFVALPAALAVPLPSGIDMAVGACIGVPACTAHAAIGEPGALAGKTVMVAGGAGAVGHCAVRLASLAGATVIATVSSAHKAEIARAAGASHVIDYRSENVVEAVLELTGGAGVERVVEVDLGMNLEIAVGVLRAGGSIAAYASSTDVSFDFDPVAHKGITLRFVHAHRLDQKARAAATRDINRYLGGGMLHLPIATRFRLEETARAHEVQASGTAIGNIVIEVTPGGVL